MRTSLFRCILFGMALLPLAGCSPSGDPSSPAPVVTRTERSAAETGAFKDLDPWTLKTADPGASRGNRGLFLGNGLLGATFGPTGGASKESVAYAAGRYDGKETIEKLPNWHEIGLPAPRPGAPYEQTLDMRRGVLTTKMGATTVTSFMAIVPPYCGVVQVRGEGAPKTVTVGAEGKPLAAAPEVEKLLAAHTAAWEKRWARADIRIDGDPEAQQLVRKLLFDLLQSVREGAAHSIAPETLSGDFYKGHIFWDAEVWMFPALLAQHPELARSLLDYRFARLDAARRQAASKGFKGIDFPWESARSGAETAPGGFSEGRHVTAGVGWAHWQYWLATGDKPWLAARGWPVLSGVADYFATRARKNASGGYDLAGVTGPDELQMDVKNNAYTNAMAANCLRAAAAAAQALGKTANPLWATVATGLVLPRGADGVVLKCDGDTGKATKQADGELLLWPAQAIPDRKAAGATFDFHRKRPIKNGPAMTDSVHALLAARLGRAAEADEEFRNSYRPFVRGPFLLFSEKRSLDRCVFATAAGGVLQSVLYGFGGLDFSRPEGVVSETPALPAGWKKLTVTGIRRGAKSYTLTVTPARREFLPVP